MIAPTKNQVLWIPGIGTSYDSRAPEPTQLVPGMNGPVLELEPVPVPDLPIPLRPETYTAHKL